MTETGAGEITFAKGHGTGNDFVLLPDPEGALALDAALVAALCDRRTGLGGDGVLRLVRTAHALEPEVTPQAAVAEWFMDYRNADGSKAEMCGNGIRVFVRYLLDHALASGPQVSVATRSGVVEVRVEPNGWLAAELGPLGFPEVEAEPYVSVGATRWPAVHVTMPNPHAVVFVEDLDQAGDLRSAPGVGPAEAFPHGANVEFVVIETPGELSMRVHERGVGETRSCGTGACAVVAAARRRLLNAGAAAPGQWSVSVAGGRLRVTEKGDGTVELAGPAVLVASGVVTAESLEMMTAMQFSGSAE